MVVDKNIDFSKTMDCLPDDFFGYGFFFEIAGDKKTFSPELFDVLFGFLCITMFIEIGDDNICAFLCKGIGNSTPDATIAASDNGNPILKFSTSSCFDIFRDRARFHQIFHTRLAILMLRWEGDRNFLAFCLVLYVRIHGNHIRYRLSFFSAGDCRNLPFFI